MNEQIKIVITAELDKFKQGMSQAQKTVADFQKKCANDQSLKQLQNGYANASKAIVNSFKTMATTALNVGKTIATAFGTALVGITTASVKSYADYEQLTGGVEKLFGDSANKLMEYADVAYKTCGISANKYMEQATSFSASLISSLDGDTAKAVEYTNMAMTDMADNVNVFGSNVQDVQNAYQGFAKQNYTMLDNLKLGYGGTKEEMERLIEDANKVKEANGEMADLSIESFGDVVEAIHIVQTEMNITGTTTKEAEKTVSGSIGMMKGAWQNFLTALGTGEGVEEKTQILVESIGTVWDNLKPVIKRVLESIPQAIEEISPEIYEKFEAITGWCQDTLFPVLEEVGQKIGEAISWIVDNWGTIVLIGEVILSVATAITIVNTALQIISGTIALVNFVMSASPITWIILGITALIAILVLLALNWDKVKEACGKAWDWIVDKTKALCEGVEKWWNETKEKTMKNVSTLCDTVSKWWSELKEKVVNKVMELKTNIINKFNEIKTGITDKVNSAKEKVTNVFDGIKTGISNTVNSLKGIVTNAFNNVKSAMLNPIDTAKGLIKSAIDTIKGFFNFKISFPHVPLPHFSLSPSGWKVGDLLKGSIPKLSVQFYAKGGVFDSPTMFNNNGGLGILGENGAEAIVPLENNLGWLNKMADMLTDRMGTGQPIYLTVDGKVFAETAISTINQNTKQTGKLGLRIK